MATGKQATTETEIKKLLGLTPAELDKELVKAVEANPELAAEVFGKKK